MILNFIALLLSLQRERRIFDSNLIVFDSPQAISEVPQELQSTALTQLLRKVVPIVDSTIANISPGNPYGSSVNQLETDIIKNELYHIVGHLREPHISTLLQKLSEDEHYRLEYLVKELEQRHNQILTIPFMNFALSGAWSKIYTNVRTIKADRNLVFSITQSINPTNSTDTKRISEGTLEDVVHWEYNENTEQTARGVFNVISKYKITGPDELLLTIEQHLLNADSLPVTIPAEELVFAIQKSVPFENFDPDNVMLKTTYVDADLRIVHLEGDKFHNVFNIFTRKLSDHK